MAADGTVLGFDIRSKYCERATIEGPAYREDFIHADFRA